MATNWELVEKIRQLELEVASHQQRCAKFEAACDDVELEYKAKPARAQLTDAEREAVETCIADDEAATAYTRAATLRGLLERLQ